MTIPVSDAQREWASDKLGYQVADEPGVIVHGDGSLEHVVFLVPIEDKPLPKPEESDE